MPRLPSWIFPIVALLLLAGIGASRLDYTPLPESGNAALAETSSDDSQDSTPVWSHGADGSSGNAALAETSSNDNPDSAPVWSHGADGSSANAEEHWRKHGSEFSQYHSAEDYERGAKDFVDHPPPGTLTKHRSNGDTALYDPDTQTFAVVDSRGEPRTMFKPHNGMKYWAHQ